MSFQWYSIAYSARRPTTSSLPPCSWLLPDGRTDEKYRQKGCRTKCTIPTDDIQTKNAAIRNFRIDVQTKNTAIRAFRMDGQTKNTAIKAVAQSVRMVAVRLSAPLYLSAPFASKIVLFFPLLLYNRLISLHNLDPQPDGRLDSKS
eukprot:scaffold5978_cov157-Amphora_coffeaeformis.AAC.6